MDMGCFESESVRGGSRRGDCRARLRSLGCCEGGWEGKGFVCVAGDQTDRFAALHYPLKSLPPLRDISSSSSLR
jgi:hypothetical protein